MRSLEIPQFPSVNLTESLTPMRPHPLSLPKYVILMSDEATRPLACAVAKLMADMDHTVYIDDFETPITNAFMAMWDKDYFKDYGNPDVCRGLMTEAIGEHSERDMIVYLRQWFVTHFGADQLGKMGLKRALAEQTLNEHIYVFRDGTPAYVKAFASIHPRDIYCLAKLDPTLTPEQILLAMEAAWGFVASVG